MRYNKPINDPGKTNAMHTSTLREYTKKYITEYFNKLDGQATSAVYNMVMAEVEAPLIETVLAYTNGNQSQAAEILGLSRGTLRKKIAEYNIIVTNCN